MKFVYMGCEGAPETSTHYGVEFTIGVPSEVTDQAAIAKLSRHPHFVAVGAVPVPAYTAPVAAIEVEEAPEEAPDDDRAATLELARSLGIRIGRKSVDTLKREIAEAQGDADHD